MKKTAVLLSVLICVSLYLFFVFHSFNKLPLGDEIYQVAVMDVRHDYPSPPNVRDFGLWGHPTLYGETLIALGKIFSPDYVTARGLGICLFFAVVAVMVILSHEVKTDRKAAGRMALLSVFLYSTHPMVIQGSLLLDRDNTFFTLFLSLFLLFLLRDRKKQDVKNFILCVLSLTLLMWGKLAPFPVVAFSLLLFESLSQRERWLRDFLIFLSGAALFAVTWFAYCAYFPREGVLAKDIFRYLFKSAGTRYQPSSSGIGSAADIAKTTVYLILWLNPFLLVLGVLYGVHTAGAVFKRTRLQDADIFSVFTTVIFMSYVLYGRIMFGFPKYHYPMLFMLCMMAANSVVCNEWKTTKNTVLCFMFFLLTYLLYVVFLDDIYRVAYFDVKKSLMDTGSVVHSIKTKIIVQSLILCFSFAGVMGMLKLFIFKNFSRVFTASLLICGLALNFSQNTFQMQPDFSTISCYGETGTSAVLDYVRGRLRDDRLMLSSMPLMFYLKQLNKRYHPDAFFNSRQNVLKDIQDARTQFFIYGVNSHTLGQVTEVFQSPPVKDYLLKNFSAKKIGTYTVWERRKS